MSFPRLSLLQAITPPIRWVNHAALTSVVLVTMACSGQSPDEEGSPDGDSKAPLGSECASPGDCSDGDPCNGEESCEKGFCQDGSPMDCADDEVCVPSEGECRRLCDLDGDSFDSTECGGDDCDDSDADAYPGNREFCVGPDGEVDDAAMLRDEDCDPKTLGDDADDDGFYDSRCGNRNSSGVAVFGVDCNDSNDLVRPGFQEICDGLDNDCNGKLDYPGEDDDGDGFADCHDLQGQEQFDCDDEAASVNPGVEEDVCDGVDSDCDGIAEDADKDGFYSAESTCVLEDPGANLDCDDDDAALSCPVSIFRGTVDCASGCAVSCGDNFADCNGELIDGCESDLRVSSSNCGACGSACAFGCENGVCRQPISVAGGAGNTCAVLDTGHVACWGAKRFESGTRAPTLLPGGPADNNFAEVSSSEWFSCALRTNGRVSCWGNDIYSTLGNGADDNQPESVPQDVVNVSDAIQMNTGQFAACVVLSNGQLHCWGTNEYGVLGLGLSDGAAVDVATRLLDADVDGKTVKFGGGYYHSCALLSDKHVACWGSDAEGQVGDGDDGGGSHSTPVRVATGVINNNAEDISVGRDKTCAILTGGTVACWGDSVLAPTLVTGLPTSRIESVALGEGHTCALTADGEVYCWGGNTWGQLGDGTQDSSASAVRVLLDDTVADPVTDIGLGSFHSCALRESGRLQCWGVNFTDQLGIGQTSDISTVPQDVTGAPEAAVQVSASRYGTCVVSDRGGAQCWGQNSSGQLGTGTSTFEDELSPVPFDTSTLSAPILRMDHGGSSGCALLGSGQVACWGNDGWGQLGDGSATSDTQPSPTFALGDLEGHYAVDVAVGEGSFACAVRQDGNVVCWGNDFSNALGNGPESSQAVHAPGLVAQGVIDGNAVAVTAGYNHACALLISGEVTCWGSNLEGALGVDPETVRSGPSPLDPVSGSVNDKATAIVAAQRHTCALTADRNISCWGTDNSGSLGNGVVLGDSFAPAPTVIDVIDGNAQSLSLSHFGTGCATLTSGEIACWGGGVESPTLVSTTGALDHVVSVGMGQNHRCASDARGAVACWGSDHYGQLGNGPQNGSSVALPSPIYIPW